MNPTTPAPTPTTTPAQPPQQTPAQVTPLFGPVQQAVTDIEKAANSIAKHWKSPAFWTHALVQLLTWLAYFQTASTPIKIGTLSVSGVSLVTYLWHLASTFKSSKIL